MQGVSLTHPVIASLLFIWVVSLTHSMLASFLCGKFYYASHAGFIFISGISLKHPVLPSFFIWGGSLTHPVLASFLISGISITNPVLASFLSREFLLHIPCWLYSSVGSFSYTSIALFFFFFFSFFSFFFLFFLWLFFFFFFLIWGVSLRHPVMDTFLRGEFLLNIPCWLHFYLGSFSYTSHAVSIFIQGIILTHPVLASFFFFYLGSFSYTSRAGFILLWGVSLTHPMLTLFLCGEFLLHIPCRLCFYVGSFSYTSRADFVFMWGVSLTHPVLS